MSVQLARRPLTERLLTALRAVQVDGKGLLVGDCVIPVGSGWQGEVNKPGSSYVPYVVLTPLTATRSAGSLSDSQGDWVMPYAVQSFSVLPDAAQWMADETRAALAGLKHALVDLVVAHYKIDQVVTDSFGGVSRIGQGSTTFYGIQDGVSMSLRKQRS